MLHQARSVIARLAGRQRVVELDERVYAKGYVLVGCESAGANALFVDRDEAALAGLRAVAVREAYYPLTSGRKRRPSPADGFAQIAAMPFVTVPS